MRKNFGKYIEEDLEVITLHATDHEYRKHVKREKKCKSVFVKYIADSQLEYMKDELMAKDIYDALKKIFERKSIAGQLWLRKKLLTLMYNESGHIKDHLLEFDKTVRELKAIGAKLEEMDSICQLLLTLPKSFDSLVTALETLYPETISMDFVKSRLLDEYNKRNGNKESIRSTEGIEMVGLKFKWYNCGKAGHKMSECQSLDNSRYNECKCRNMKKQANIAEDEYNTNI